MNRMLILWEVGGIEGNLRDQTSASENGPKRPFFGLYFYTGTGMTPDSFWSIIFGHIAGA